jgi:hypothetical protein
MKAVFSILTAILATLAVSTNAVAQNDANQSARLSARRALEIANYELRQYLQVEYPRERRHLDAEIKLTEAEVQAYQERLREWAPFDKFSTGRPLIVSIQNMRLCLLEAELRLKDLRAERNNLIRFHSDRWRLLELRAYDARSRIAELERGNEPLPAGAAVARQ